jgi:formylglycine-generating enzyme required for sulfatase activity
MNFKKITFLVLAIIFALIGFNAHSNQVTTINEHGLNINMVSIPGSYFVMGCKYGDCKGQNQPRHIVDIKAFKMSEAEVTFKQWDMCVEAGSCSHVPDDKGWGRGDRPVIYISWNDINSQFIPWLNKITGLNYRLPSESEWEYAARAGTTTAYNTGSEINCSQAQYGYQSERCGTEEFSMPVKSFKPNAFGLYDMHGNNGEVVQDCWHKNYIGAPTDGSAWTERDCVKTVDRGGSWYNHPVFLRVFDRYVAKRTSRSSSRGFRLALSNK